MKNTILRIAIGSATYLTMLQSPIMPQPVVASISTECWWFRIKTAKGGILETRYHGTSYNNCKYQLMKQYPGCTIIDSRKIS